MEGFDTMGMPYLASPLSINNIQGGGDYLNPMPQLDIPPHQPPYDHETFASGDDMSFSQPPLSAHHLRRFSNAQFDEPFPDMITPFEPLQPEQTQQPDTSIDHNHKLLGFSLPVYNFTLLDYSLRRTSLSMTAQLHGMFFLAESPWTTTSPTGEANIHPPLAELTCYRRNLFQITGSVTLPRTLRYIMTEQGDRIPILALELTVSATESVEGNPVKIISVPWKTPATNTTGQPEDKVEKEPPAIPLDTMAGQDMDSDYATFSIAWKRLQFRIATANNGRRKELQQHFVVRLKIVATLSTGAKIAISEAHSGPVIVRGRSPRNFQSRKDLPLSGSAAASRKNTQATASLARNNNNNTNNNATEASRSQKAPNSKRSRSPQESVPAPRTLQLEGDSKSEQQTQENQTSKPSDWPAPPSATLHSTVFTSSSPNCAVPAHAQPALEQSRPPGKRRRISSAVAPINLSLDDSAESPGGPTTPNSNGNNNTSAPQIPTSNQSNSRTADNNSNNNIDAPSAKPRKGSTSNSTRQPPPQNHSNNHTSEISPLMMSQSFPLIATSLVSPPVLNPNDTADLLYEYFPLGLDDWQAPVDAVYRPHVVHHTNMPDDPKAIAARSRSKRYFAGEGN